MKLLNLFRHPRELVDLSVEQLSGILDKAPPIIVDVRTTREFSAGHIPGAISMPLGQEKMVAEKWPTDASLVLVCKTGHRSQAAAATLFHLGYTHVAHLQGGMDAWRRASMRTTEPRL